MFKRNSIKQLGGGYGLGFHWTTWTADKEKGIPAPFEETVNKFDVDKFVKQAKDLGAKHILLTSCHQLQYFPGPNPFIDSLIANRTCKRDLIGELSEALKKEDIKLILYYHHGCDGAHQDPDWWKVCGAGDFYSDTFYKNIIDIVSYIGNRYGDKIDAYWFDAGYGYWRRGYVPWEELSEAARVGNPNRLITYNPGVRNWGSYTECQDYYSGETHYYDDVPHGEKTTTGLDWYAFMALHRWLQDPNNPDGAQWGIDETCFDKQDWDIPDSKGMAGFVKAYNEIGSTVTFNMLCYNDGSIHPVDKKAIEDMRKYL